MLTIDLYEINRVKRLLGKHSAYANAVIAKALNTAGKKAKEKLPEPAGNAYQFDSGAPVTPKTRSIVRMKHAGQKFRMELRYKTGSLGLDHYVHYYGGRVYVGVHKGDMKEVDGAFVPSLYAGKSKIAPGLIFKRVGRERLPIKRLYGVPVGSMFQHETVEEAFGVITEEEYNKAMVEYVGQIKRRAKRAGT